MNKEEIDAIPVGYMKELKDTDFEIMRLNVVTRMNRALTSLMKFLFFNRKEEEKLLVFIAELEDIILRCFDVKNREELEEISIQANELILKARRIE